MNKHMTVCQKRLAKFTSIGFSHDSETNLAVQLFISVQTDTDRHTDLC